MRRTAEDAAKTRVALLKAALKSFEEKGWRGATFEYVAERAGVTRGALRLNGAGAIMDSVCFLKTMARQTHRPTMH